MINQGYKFASAQAGHIDRKRRSRVVGGVIVVNIAVRGRQQIGHARCCGCCGVQHDVEVAGCHKDSRGATVIGDIASVACHLKIGFVIGRPDGVGVGQRVGARAAVIGRATRTGQGQRGQVFCHDFVKGHGKGDGFTLGKEAVTVCGDGPYGGNVGHIELDRLRGESTLGIGRANGNCIGVVGAVICGIFEIGGCTKANFAGA